MARKICLVGYTRKLTPAKKGASGDFLLVFVYSETLGAVRLTNKTKNKSTDNDASKVLDQGSQCRY